MEEILAERIPRLLRAFSCYDNIPQSKIGFPEILLINPLIIVFI